MASIRTAGSSEEEDEELVSKMYLQCLAAAAGTIVQYPVMRLQRQRWLMLLSVSRMNPSLDDSSVPNAVDAAAGIKDLKGVSLPPPPLDGSVD